MITTEQAPLKGSPASVAQAQVVPPPAYYDTQSRTPYQQRPSPPPPPPTNTVARRFLSAFLVATIIWLLFGFFVDRLVELGRIARNGGPGVSWPAPADGRSEHCIGSADWTSVDPPQGSWYKYRGSTSFELPLDADLHYLLSRGSFSHGNVHVLQPEGDSDKIKVDVVVQYYHTEVFDATNVCLLKRGRNEHGVGIFTPRYRNGHRRDSRDNLVFEVTVRLPKHSDLQIKKFETDFSTFSHQLDDLASVNFARVALSTTNSHISAEYLVVGDSTSIKSTNGAIRIGQLNSTDADIGTTNGHISVGSLFSKNAHVHTTSGSIIGTFESREITLDTTNGPINAKSLIADHATVHTANGKITGKYVASELELITSNSPIDVESVKTNHAQVLTTSGAIRGHFESTNELDFSTTNSPIDVDVRLTNIEKALGPAKLALSVTNGKIDARMSLLAESSKSRSHFVVIASSINAPMNLNFLESPVDSILMLNGKTTNGRISALLPPAYEGSFELATSSLFPLEITKDDDVKDPAGRGRTRHTQWNRIGRGPIIGSIWWGSQSTGKEEGKVVLQTTNSPVTLSM